jgi:hypothetical protein
VDPRAGLDDVEKRKILALPGLELRLLGRPARSQMWKKVGAVCFGCHPGMRRGGLMEIMSVLSMFCLPPGRESNLGAADYETRVVTTTARHSIKEIVLVALIAPYKCYSESVETVLGGRKSLWHGACLWMDECSDMCAQNILTANARNNCHELHTRGVPSAWEFCVWVTDSL